MYKIIATGSLFLQSLLGLSGAGKLDGDLSIAPQRQAIKMTNIGGGATKQVTSADIENFVNEPCLQSC